MPTQANATYTVFDSETTWTLTPPFTQQPPCGYTANMVFTWTIPSGAPIYPKQDPYALLVSTQNVNTAGIYTVFLDNAITYGQQSWNERVSYDLTIVNPCLNTTMFTTNTTAALAALKFEYTVSDPTKTLAFEGVSDTVTNNITTGGNCGNYVYSLASNDTTVGTPYISVVSLLNSKGIQIYTENTDYIGNYTITMTATMQDYPEKTATFTFDVQVKDAVVVLPQSVAFPPILTTDVSGTIQLEPGASWSL